MNEPWLTERDKEYQHGFQVQKKISAQVWWTYDALDGEGTAAKLAEELHTKSGREVRVVSRTGQVTYRIKPRK